MPFPLEVLGPVRVICPSESPSGGKILEDSLRTRKWRMILFQYATFSLFFHLLWCIFKEAGRRRQAKHSYFASHLWGFSSTPLEHNPEPLPTGYRYSFHKRLGVVPLDWGYETVMNLANTMMGHSMCLPDHGFRMFFFFFVEMYQLWRGFVQKKTVILRIKVETQWKMDTILFDFIHCNRSQYWSPGSETWDVFFANPKPQVEI